MRFVYQVTVQGRFTQASQNAQQQHQQQETVSCQAQCSFVVWPLADRGSSSGLDRRATMSAAHGQNGVSSTAVGSPAAGSTAAVDLLTDTELIDYKLGMQVTKLRWEVRGLGRQFCMQVGTDVEYRNADCLLLISM